ncbi:MAG: uridine kinase [Streptococcaceae bacterium]|jgi:uridine kinase|nr:uridine kinase [Streptococcaceae bacterium]
MIKKPMIIGVAGGSASGKTSVSQAILANFSNEQITLIAHDAYYKDQSHLDFEARLQTNYDHPLAFDTPYLIAQLQALQAGQAVEIPIYDYTEHTRSQKTYSQKSVEVIIVEGILVLDDQELRDMMDIKIFVDTDDDVRIIRRIKRDMAERGRSLESIITQYLTAVKPMYHEFIEPTKRYADLIIPEGISNLVGLDLINTKIAAVLGDKKAQL